MTRVIVINIVKIWMVGRLKPSAISESTRNRKTLWANIERSDHHSLILYQVRLRIGMYYPFIADFLRVFPEEQIKVVRYEDYVSRPSEIINEVCSFLGLGKKTTPFSQFILRGEGDSPPLFGRAIQPCLCYSSFAGRRLNVVTFWRIPCDSVVVLLEL